MSLITEISGSTLVYLAELSATASSGASSRTASGGSAATTDLRGGLVAGAGLFQQSVVRLNNAIAALHRSDSLLTKLSSISDTLSDIATKAAELQTTTEERTRLNSRLQSAIVSFQQILDSSVTGSTDFLSVSDLKDILTNAGINVNAATKLAQTFTKVGGADSQLGYETITLVDNDHSVVNPLSVNVSTYDDAQKAKEALAGLKKSIAADAQGIHSVFTELASAFTFARAGKNAFGRESAQPILDIGQADKIASDLVSEIKRSSGDPAIAPHSDLDAVLRKALLG